VLAVAALLLVSALVRPATAQSPAVSSIAAQSEQLLLRLATAGSAGTEYDVAQAICRQVNLARAERRLLCTVEPTRGSTEVIKGVLEGRYTLGIAQSDIQYQAFQGLGRFRTAGPQRSLRAVFSVYPEPFTALTRPGTGISQFAQFRGRTFNVGNPGSGSHAAVALVFQHLGWKSGDFPLVYQQDSDAVGTALCDGTVDGFLAVTGLHSQQIERPAAACQARLVPLEPALIDALAGDSPFLQKLLIPAGTYSNNPQAVATVAVIASVVTTAAVPDEVINQVVRAVFERLADFRAAHPALNDLTPQQMLGCANAAPIHDGAMSYFRAAGLLMVGADAAAGPR